MSNPQSTIEIAQTHGGDKRAVSFCGESFRRAVLRFLDNLFEMLLLYAVSVPLPQLLSVSVSVSVQCVLGA